MVYNLEELTLWEWQQNRNGESGKAMILVKLY